MTISGNFRGSVTAAALGTLLGAASLGACLVGTDGLSRDGQMDASVPDTDAPMTTALFDATAAGDGAPQGSTAPDDASTVATDAADAADAQMDAGPNVLPYDKVILADTPYAYWPLDEAAGMNLALDVVGQRAATAQGSVTFGVPGVSGTAAHFTGGSQLNAGDVFDVLGQDPFAMEIWIKADRTDAGFQNALGKRGSATTDGYVLYGNGNDTSGSAAVSFEEGWNVDGSLGTRGAFGGVDFAADWTHLVVTLDTSNKIHLYINGVETPNTYDGTGGPAPNGIDLTFGNDVVGAIDEIALYRHALTAVQVNAHYRARRP